MGRRTVLLIVAALIASLGAGMVFLYVRGADNRAQASQQPVQVLQAVTRISPGETMADALAAGKIRLGSVPKAQVLVGAVNTTTGMEKNVALSTIYPNEQIISSKFGTAGDQETLTIPDGSIAISISLTDTGRVAGFVAPGAHVAIFVNTTPKDGDGKATGSRLLLDDVPVIAVGATTAVSAPADTKAAPASGAPLETLFTLAVTQDQAERIMLADAQGDLNFALLNDKSKVSPGPGVDSSNLFR